MTRKVKDLAVAVGSYVKDGKTKKRYLNIGSVLKTDDGNEFILLDRTFNPAGVTNPDGKDSVLISMFDPKDKAETSSTPITDNVLSEDQIPF